MTDTTSTVASLKPSRSMHDTVQPAELTSPPGASQICRGAFFAPPEIGAEVWFQRSPTEHPEKGTVWGRQFGTGIVEVVDMQGKSLRLTRGQYTVSETPSPNTHGRQELVTGGDAGGQL